MTLLQVPYGHATVNRLAPLMPSEAYKTYGMSMPLKTHWVPATCEDIDCEAYLSGWASTFDLATDLGQRQYEYCKSDRTRSFSEQRVTQTLVKLVYAPGNRCFRSGDHRLPLERPATLYVREGDWRGNPRGEVRVHKSAKDWVDDFAEHHDRLATAIQEG